MDFLVKQNIIKKQKAIIDIGHKYIKILGARYAKGHVEITESCKLVSTPFFFEGDLVNVKELACNVQSILNSRKELKNCEISLSVPSSMVFHKIVAVKNVNPKDLDKYIKKEHMSFNKVSSLTHNMDWAYLGQKEENSETIRYCLVSAINKTSITPLLFEFEKRKLKITGISFPIYNLISLADLYANDYEHLNRMLIDFGISSTRVVVQHEGVAVYSREIGIGFKTFADGLTKKFPNVDITEIIALLTQMGLKKDSFLDGILDKDAFFEVTDMIVEDFQNELLRIIQMCESDGFNITKIICASAVPDGLLSFFEDNGIKVEVFELAGQRSANGSGYVLALNDTKIDTTYGSSIGLCVNTLQ